MQPFKTPAHLEELLEQSAGSERDAHGGKDPFRAKNGVLLAPNPTTKSQIGGHRRQRIQQKVVRLRQLPVGKADRQAEDQRQRTQTDGVQGSQQRRNGPIQMGLQECLIRIAWKIIEK